MERNISLSFDPLDKASIGALIDEVEQFKDRLSVRADAAIYSAARDAEEQIKSDVHIGVKEDQWSTDQHDPGRLKRSIHMVPGFANGSSSYEIVLDAKAYNSEHYPYSSVEQGRGGEHDFLRNVTEQSVKESFIRHL